jgi:AraC family transcriptional regulator
LTQIALACGFSDQSHFTRVFLQATGATPHQWRRANVN